MAGDPEGVAQAPCGARAGVERLQVAEQVASGGAAGLAFGGKRLIERHELGELFGRGVRADAADFSRGMPRGKQKRSGQITSYQNRTSLQAGDTSVGRGI